MGWHLIYFLAMFACIIGGMILSSEETEISLFSSPRTLKVWSVSAAVLTAAVFLTAEWADEPFLEIFQETIWDTFGAQHFVAFVVGALALLHIVVSIEGRTMADSTNIVAQLKMPLMATYGLFSLDHFWELLTESWEIFIISEALIERVEQIIVLPAFIVLAYVGWKLAVRDTGVSQITDVVEPS